MAGQPAEKNEVELQAAPSTRTFHYKGLATLVLAALTTLSFAQNDTGNQASLPSRQPQPVALPSAPHPVHGVTPARGSATQPHVNPQPRLHLPPVSQGARGQTTLHGTAGYPSPGQHGADALPARRQYGGNGGKTIEHQLSSGHRVLETTQATSGSSTLHAVRYGSALTGFVEHPIKAGYVSRTYVQGGHVLYARVYRQNTFQRFGHTFSYENLVPAIAFSTAYYAWAARPWPTPVTYHWRWEAQRWYAAFGSNFTPYPSYMSLDQWLTDYLIAQNLRIAYETWQAENAPESRPAVSEPPPAGEMPPQPAGNRPYWESPRAGQRPYWEADDDGRKPYWEESSSEDTHAQPQGSKTHNSVPDSQTGSRSGSPAEASPPPLSGGIKAELNAQIKQQLVERQTQATTSNTEVLPNSLKPGHTLFRVGTPLDVAADVSGRFCALSANDYIERTGDMDENGTVPVQVKLSGISDCATGLATHVSVNDLEAMDSEQQQALTDALLAASKNMGGNGLPQAPATTPLMVAAGQTRPALDATRTLIRLQ